MAVSSLELLIGSFQEIILLSLCKKYPFRFHGCIVKYLISYVLIVCGVSSPIDCSHDLSKNELEVCLVSISKRFIPLLWFGVYRFADKKVWW